MMINSPISECQSSVNLCLRHQHIHRKSQKASNAIDVLFHVSLGQLLNNQSSYHLFETPGISCHVIVMYRNARILTYCGHSRHMATNICVNIGSGNGVLLDGPKPLIKMHAGVYLQSFDINKRLCVLTSAIGKTKTSKYKTHMSYHTAITYRFMGISSYAHWLNETLTVLGRPYGLPYIPVVSQQLRK